MKGVVFHGVADLGLDDVPEPRLEEPTFAVVVTCYDHILRIREAQASALPRLRELVELADDIPSERRQS